MKTRGMTRRELIKHFGFAAFLLHPILRNMAWAAATPFSTAPRFVMFFKGGAYQPSRMGVSSLTSLVNTPILPLQTHASDLILFKNMNILGGDSGYSKYTDYGEEHGGGLYGCTTGDRVYHTKQDSYYTYTKSESIDLRIARHYSTLSELSNLPFSSLHVAGGAHSDADNLGPGQRYISSRAWKTGDTTYSNAIEPMQNAGQVYDLLMARINLICSSSSNQPSSETAKLKAALVNKKSVLDLKIKDINDAKGKLGLDSEHSIKLDALLEQWRTSEKLVTSQIAALETSATGKTCPTLSRPTGDGTKKYNLDQLSPIHDQMISLIKLAFQWDLTRVVAFILSGASSGQNWPSKGVNSVHHSLEHSGNVDQLTILDSYYSEKFASLLTSLNAIDDGGGKTALYNSSIVLGMECWSTSSQKHSLSNVPFLFAGQGGGKFTTGRIVDAGGRNNNDLLLSCMKAAGIPDSTFGAAALCKGPII